MRLGPALKRIVDHTKVELQAVDLAGDRRIPERAPTVDVLDQAFVTLPPVRGRMRLGDPGPREYPLEGVGRINALQLGVCPNAQLVAKASEDRFLVRVIAGHPRDEVGDRPGFAVLRRGFYRQLRPLAGDEVIVE